MNCCRDLVPLHMGCIITLDQAIYAKALGVIWKKPDEFQQVVLRMLSFHVTCVFLVVLGKCFGAYGDAGLIDVLVEANVTGTSAVKAFISGKH